ncbi:ornithine decarboxylase-like [Gigantopelta aegis]|uniref:ornithine decarboxylase-like n=1 Tax=Gigantopelta aegis TaxID=1735272 RepID=UPI001B88BB1C|nr:ornithine decarboxylase-like [Gigantopelta aegis]
MKHYIGNGCVVESLPYNKSKTTLITEKIASLESEHSEDAFFVADLGDIVIKYQTWRELLPRIDPFYALKCNDDHAVIKLLADLGTSFDCASKAEIEKILNLGVSPSRIIYANPCKQKSFIRYAAKHNVKTMTFDNEAELYKVKQSFPEARLVLRILPPADFKVQCNLGIKFGCHPKKAAQLLTKAKELELNVVGISFHVGSGAEEAEAFAAAVEQAYYVFELGREMGFNFELLDVGGGFPGQKNTAITFKEVAEVLNTALDRYFPSDTGIRIIAEPGRYFVASAFTLAVNIIAKRIVLRDRPIDGDAQEMMLTPNDEPAFMYYVNDGVYGSFNCLLFDHAKVQPSMVQDCQDENTFTSSIWGPTCDGLDCIMEDCLLPELPVGAWLFFEDMGAYTMSASTCFNGMPRPSCHFYCSEDSWYYLYPEQKKKTEIRIPSKAIPILKTGLDIHSSYEQTDDVFGSPLNFDKICEDITC